MQGLFDFTLTAPSGKRAANAISEFSIIPEPATMCLLGIGSLVMLKRRKA